jgi:hypothetical protein
MNPRWVRSYLTNSMKCRMRQQLLGYVYPRSVGAAPITRLLSKGCAANYQKLS